MLLSKIDFDNDKVSSFKILFDTLNELYKHTYVLKIAVKHVHIYTLKNQSSKKKDLRNTCRKTVNDKCLIRLAAAIHSVDNRSLLFKRVPIT